MAYDSMGRVTRRTMPDATHEDFTYGATGLLTRADRARRTTSYTYDALGRKTAMTDASGTTTYTYNGTTGQLAEEDGPFADDIVLTTWDAAGRRLSTAITTDDRQQTTDVATYTYDTQGRMSTVTGAPGAFTYTTTAPAVSSPPSPVRPTSPSPRPTTPSTASRPSPPPSSHLTPDT